MAEALASLMAPNAWLLIILGVLFGMLIGVMPGMGSSLAMAMILPFTFYMSMMEALILLISCYTSALYGGAICSVLLGIPGSAGNIVTTFDGYPMAKQGKAGLAIGGAALSSFVGNVSTAFLLLGLAPFYVGFALKFGTHEIFMVALWGFAISIIIAPGSKGKSLIAGCIGVVLSCIGLSRLMGIPRFTFGSPYLLGGVPIVPAIIGVFGIYAVLASIFEERDLVTVVRQKVYGLSGFEELRKGWSWVVMSGGSVLGFIVGLIPGTGSLVATLIGWGMFKKVSPLGEQYGKGCIEGVLVAESTNNATHPGAIMTTAILGVPGAVEMVILLAAFTLHGLRCGPLLLKENPQFLYIIFIIFIVSSFVSFGITWVTLRGWIKVIETSKAFVWPIVVFLCIIGAYAVAASGADVLIMLGLGVFSWWMDTNGFSRVAFIMGLVLGPIMEYEMRMAIQLAPPQAFFTKPIAMGIFLLFIITTYVFVKGMKTAEMEE